MRSSRGIRPLAMGAGLFVAGLIFGAVLTSWASAPAQFEIRKDDILVSYFPDNVMALSYVTPRGMTTVQRSMPGSPFQVLSTSADGRAAQRCTSPADLSGRLEHLTTLTARRGISLEQRDRDFPVQLGVIQVRDTVIGEPSGPVLVFTNKDRTAIAVILDGNAVEVTLGMEELQWLETACAALARSEPPGA